MLTRFCTKLSLATALLTVALTATANGASVYTETWDNDTATWGAVGSQTSVTQVSPDDFLRLQPSGTSFALIGAATTTKTEFLGNYNTADIKTVRVDARPTGSPPALNGLRIVFRAVGGTNGWYHAFPSSELTLGSWQTLTASLDPTWDDATAIANGWVKGHANDPSFANTLSNVGRVQLMADRAANGGSGVTTYDFDNFQITNVAVPEPATGFLTLLGAVGLAAATGRRGRSRRDLD